MIASYNYKELDSQVYFHVFKSIFVVWLNFAPYCMYTYK